MANRNVALQHMLGCASFQAMQRAILSTAAIRLNIPRVLYPIALPSRHDLALESMTALFPWAAIDLAWLMLTRAIWIGVSLAFSIHTLFPPSAFRLIIPHPGMGLFLGSTLAYALVFVTFTHTMTTTGQIINRMSGKKYDRDDPSDIESEFVWGYAKEQYDRAATKLYLYVMLGALVAVFLVAAYDRGPSNAWMIKHIQRCRNLVDGDANAQPIVVDLTSSHHQFLHTITQPMLNRAGFEPRFREQLGNFYRVYCYPQRMLFYDQTIAAFEQCLAKVKVPWSAAWETASDADTVCFGGFAGLLFASILLLLSRCLTRK